MRYQASNISQLRFVLFSSDRYLPLGRFLYVKTPQTVSWTDWTGLEGLIFKDNSVLF